MNGLRFHQRWKSTGKMTRLLTQFLSHLQDTHNTLQPFSVQYAYGTDHAGLKTLLQFHTMGKMGKEREKAESGRKAQKFPNFLAKLIGKCGVTGSDRGRQASSFSDFPAQSRWSLMRGLSREIFPPKQTTLIPSEIAVSSTPGTRLAFR